MHEPFTATSSESLLQLKQLLTERITSRRNRNLVYFASGTRIKEEYYELPFDNVILVDKAFRNRYSEKGKVITIGLTALEATSLFKEASIKFDVFVCINEGLSEGGGSYPIHSNWSLSNILPILKDKYIHIACPGYYNSQRNWKKMFNLPQQAILLGESDVDYIDPKVFSDYYQYNKEFCVWRITKQSSMPVSFKSGKRQVTVQRKNAWDDIDVLDSLFVRCPSHEANNVQRAESKAMPLKRNHSAEQILHYCNIHKIEKLGLTPWLSGRYEAFFDYLEANETKYPYPKKIYFYHLNKGDMKYHYLRAGVSTTSIIGQD